MRRIENPHKRSVDLSHYLFAATTQNQTVPIKLTESRCAHFENETLSCAFLHTLPHASIRSTLGATGFDMVG